MKYEPLASFGRFHEETYRPISTAPRDGSVVEVSVYGGFSQMAFWWPSRQQWIAADLSDIWHKDAPTHWRHRFSAEGTESRQ